VLRRGAVAALPLLFLLPACARHVAPPIPEGEDYLRPTLDEQALPPRDARALDEAWTRVLAGDVDRAVREYQRVLRGHPGLVPAETGLAYARLRGGQAGPAAAGFAAVIERRPDYVPALVGGATTAMRRGRGDEALELYRRALAQSPGEALLRRRVGELKLQLADRHMAAARAAREGGDLATTSAEYAAALHAAPELASVRLDLAEILVARDDVAGAIETLQADPAADRSVALRLGSLLLAQERYSDARDVYQGLLDRDPADAEAERGVAAAREALDFQAQPQEYRRIAETARVSRADLAALIAVKVTALARVPARSSRVAVDIGASWARPHIATVLGLGIMDVYPNHTFQPEARVRRGDLARSVARVLDLLSVPVTPARPPTDVGPSHLDRQAVLRVLGAGVMPLTPNGAFEPWRSVSGREAVETIEALARVVGP